MCYQPIDAEILKKQLKKEIRTFSDAEIELAMALHTLGEELKKQGVLDENGNIKKEMTK